VAEEVGIVTAILMTVYLVTIILPEERERRHGIALSKMRADAEKRKREKKELPPEWSYDMFEGPPVWGASRTELWRKHKLTAR
jgi:hypothetical protein